MQGPKRIATILLALVVLEMGFRDYWEYSHAYHQNPATFMDVLQGTADAPSQYRIGVLKPAGRIMQSTHLGLRHILTFNDVFMCCVAVFTLFFLLRRSLVYANAVSDRQWFGAAAFVVLVQFYLAWVTWYQRPETMTTAALVSLFLLLLTVRLPLAATVAAQLLIAAAQGFVRADVDVAMFAGAFLVCLTASGDGLSLPRRLQMAVSTLAIILAASIQYYLMHVLYPHASYRDVPVFQLPLQFKQPGQFIAFTLFILPYAWLIRTLARTIIGGRLRLESPSAALVLGSMLYMGMWWCLGRIEEVRIFLPFALGLAPLTVGVVMRYWLDASAPAGEPA